VKKHSLLALLVVLVALFAFSLRVGAQRRNRLETQEPEKRTLSFSEGGGLKTLEVDILFGSIDVAGYDGRTVELVSKKTIRADSDDRLLAAKMEVKLDFVENSDTISIKINDPRHDRLNQSRGRGSWVDPGYDVSTDLELRVPRQTRLRLKTVSGNVVSKNVAGDFDVEGINGSVDLKDLSGSGRVHTINGAINAVFASSPKTDSHFGSINGIIDVTLPRNLSADIRFKSFNGGVYTDFPITPLPSATTQELRSGRIEFKNEFSSARIGTGGPVIEFDGFNGDVRIRQAK
jgi:hypothetical protein